MWLTNAAVKVLLTTRLVKRKIKISSVINGLLVAAGVAAGFDESTGLYDATNVDPIVSIGASLVGEGFIVAPDECRRESRAGVAVTNVLVPLANVVFAARFDVCPHDLCKIILDIVLDVATVDF